ncbi:Replication factor C subunit 4 [Echinococcus granulosus]|uniref:Replication factor C subunit 4 n=1 Tax=Echinococcus granulosus TaxID=6210 RepID=W6UIQ3_ECHGR|nr:Replication factor C subunit 4 [Echinococcus granulosus]EUB61011.1 Replication factor C subunit 4 [Echinococcus granulosus]
MDRFLTGPAASKKDNSGGKVFIPWVEKYRPKTVNDVAQQAEVVSVLRKCLEGADLPNLLFYGPPGTGKTSLILALARQLFGPLYSDRVLELNASDERGIGVIREKVKNFSKLAVSSNAEGASGSVSPPPYKLVVLDEADSMTAPAQAALRRLMETDVKNTRFCLTCNYVTRIIGPITSRCAKFRFKPLDSEVARSRLRYIADAENIAISDATLDHLLVLCEGDLRQGITFLQSALRFATPCGQKGSTKSVPVTRDDLDRVATVVPEQFENALISAAKKRDFDALQSTILDFTGESLSAPQFLTQLQSRIMDSTEFSDRSKQKILQDMATVVFYVCPWTHTGPTAARGAIPLCELVLTVKGAEDKLLPGKWLERVNQSKERLASKVVQELTS